ncbi:hypothetical protein MBLNU230_g1620t1 [Neophaeotheca triangularis]
MFTPIAVAGLSLAAAVQSATVHVDPCKEYQKIDGTGISQAFQRSLYLYELDEGPRNEVLDLLFTEKGAGLTILRNGIGSTPNQEEDYMKSIAPTAPASNDSELNFIPFPRDDQYQVWLSKEAKARGVNKFYANAWSADGYMKTNGTDFWGGYLCGVWNASCESGDWRQAYADKLVRYVQMYEEEGIHIDYLGPWNEPDLATSYASMLSNGRQAADFIRVLHPTLQAAGLTTEIACCEGTGWEPNREILEEIEEYGQSDNLGLVTSHGYTSYPSFPFDTPHPVWQSEWSTFDDINYNWYTPGGNISDGITWANNIRNTFADANVNAFLFWWGAAEKTDTNEFLIWINGTEVYRPTKRLWAMAHFGKRFVRQGAYRIDAESNMSSLNATAFANTDGSVAVQVINNSNDTETVVLELPFEGRRVQTFLTNEEVDLKEGVACSGKNAAVADVPAQSLMSFYVCG